MDKSKQGHAKADHPSADKPRATFAPVASKQAPKPEGRDRHVKEIRDALQQLQRRLTADRPAAPSESDPNQTLLKGVFAHLDALDGNPEAQEPQST